jgi:hypothetical protein
MLPSVGSVVWEMFRAGQFPIPTPFGCHTRIMSSFCHIGCGRITQPKATSPHTGPIHLVFYNPNISLFQVPLIIPLCHRIKYKKDNNIFGWTNNLYSEERKETAGGRRQCSGRGGGSQGSRAGSQAVRGRGPVGQGPGAPARQPGARHSGAGGPGHGQEEGQGGQE